MNFRQKITLYLLLSIVLGSVAFAQVVNIPDPNLRATVREALNGGVITQTSMRQLVDLDASNKGIVNLAGLEYAINLKNLPLWGNPLADLSPISTLTSLEYLNISYCSISDISALSNLKNLASLNARGNYIVDIKPIANLTNLTRLRLNRNHIQDVTPLAELTQLEFLEIHHNRIGDHSPLDALTLSHFTYDQTCEMPPLPLEPRLENRSFPSIFTRWGRPNSNLPELSIEENIAHDDLNFGIPEFGLAFSHTSHGVTIAGIIDDAVQRRDKLLAINPYMVYLAYILMREYPPDEEPEDWPYWVRDANGKRVSDYEGGYLVDFTHPHVQNRIVQQAIAVSKCGLYDGIMFDYWSESWPVLVQRDVNTNSLRVFRTMEAEQHARDNILRRIRAETRPNFLIMGNVNAEIIPRTAPYINGGFMESTTPGDQSAESIETSLNKIKNTLTWLEQNLREPRINALEGWAVPTAPLNSPTNLRWMRAFTTLNLTHSDGYVLFMDVINGEKYWHDFWDTDLGRPVGEKGQLYENREGLYIREFTNGWAVYNHSGALQNITLPEEVISVESGLTNTLHTLPNLDGEIYLKITSRVNGPGIDGSDIYIPEPIHAIPGAVLLLDASTNPGSIARWVNLGTAGGRLLVSDRFPKGEEGEIEIPSIGFSVRRKYYTAAASRQTFGGPVHTNPSLYLGDWTLEFLCKRNGDLFFLEHQFAGFQNSPREGLQGIRLGLLLDGQELDMSIHADGVKQPTRSLNIFLEENVWTWVTIVSINGESIIAHQDGVEVSRHPGAFFDANLPLDDISIGSNSYDERHRNFNGSFSIVRVYDRALSPEEVLQNIGATVIPIANPADVNGDGVVNIFDLTLVAQALSSGNGNGDVNGDGVVNVFDLVVVAGEIGGGGAAPSASSLDPSMISAADIESWLAGAQGLGVGDANFQRGIRFLEGLLAALTPKETTLLPNYPNPFNPETWIPYRLAREAEVAITIYDTKGTLVRRLALGNQEAGYYAVRGKAAYWDGRNERGEAVASGIYIYHFRAGDYAASRRLVIVK